MLDFDKAPDIAMFSTLSSFKMPPLKSITIDNLTKFEDEFKKCVKMSLPDTLDTF